MYISFSIILFYVFRFALKAWARAKFPFKLVSSFTESEKMAQNEVNSHQMKLRWCALLFSLESCGKLIHAARLSGKKTFEHVSSTIIVFYWKIVHAAGHERPLVNTTLQ